ncbi:MAG: hypothetical protein ACRDPC_15275 [Solirubrobacteraceae bacterium]
MNALFDRGAYGDLSDYLAAVAEVWGRGAASAITKAMEDERYVEYVVPRVEPMPFLLSIPEPDFLTAVEAGLPFVANPHPLAGLPTRLSAICAQRGLPYRMEGVGRTAHFVWIGDAVVNEQVIAPALSALADPRFARGQVWSSRPPATS